MAKPVTKICVARLLAIARADLDFAGGLWQGKDQNIAVHA